MIVVTVFLAILNQMDFHLVQNRKENCHHDNIPFNLEGNGNQVFSVQTSFHNKERPITRLIYLCMLAVFASLNKRQRNSCCTSAHEGIDFWFALNRPKSGCVFNIFRLMLDQTEFRLVQINRKTVITIYIWFDLSRSSIKKVSVRIPRIVKYGNAPNMCMTAHLFRREIKLIRK